MKSTIFTSLTVLRALAGVSAIGYNESNPSDYGVEQFNDYVQVSFTNGPLTLKGVIFGRTGTDVAFSSWASRATCGTSSFPGSGFKCVDTAIQNVTYLAASGVVQNSGNVANVQLIQPNNAAEVGYYTNYDEGQGPSFSPASDDQYSPQFGDCSNVMAKTGGVVGRFIFPTRGFKVTCKGSGVQKAALNQNSWNSLLTQLSQAMRDNNYSAARFVVLRNPSTSNIATVRCHLTAPNIAQYGMDQCPDSIPAWGKNLSGADTVPR